MLLSCCSASQQVQQEVAEEEADEFDAIEKLEQLGVNRGAQLRLFRYHCMQPWQFMHELTAVQQSSA